MVVEVDCRDGSSALVSLCVGAVEVVPELASSSPGTLRCMLKNRNIEVSLFLRLEVGVLG